MYKYKVRCYDRLGNAHHEVYCNTLEQAKKVRTEWGQTIGLTPEPSNDFARYPTIWKSNKGKWERIEGY